VGHVVFALVLTRLWCLSLCPLGALLTIANRISFLRLGRDRSKCRGCNKYPRDCRTYTTPGTADCVLCGDCLEGCPIEAISFGVRRRPSAHLSPAELKTPQPT